MNIKITGKELKATEAIKNYLEEKLSRLEKYFGEDIDVLATIKIEGNVQIAELNVKANGGNFRAEAEHKDLYASIDKDIDILEGQVRKMKTKNDKQNKTDSIRKIDNEFSVEEKPEITDEILKVMYYDIKPMSPEDAKLVLEDTPHHMFLVFINIDTEKVNVIYRLKDGKNFGLVEPEA